MFQHQVWAEGAVHRKAGSNTLGEAFLMPEFLVWWVQLYIWAATCNISPPSLPWCFSSSKNRAVRVFCRMEDIASCFKIPHFPEVISEVQEFMNAISRKQIFLLNPFATDEHSKSRYSQPLCSESVFLLREVRFLLLCRIMCENLLVSKPIEGVLDP